MEQDIQVKIIIIYKTFVTYKLKKKIYLHVFISKQNTRINKLKIFKCGNFKYLLFKRVIK